MIFKKYLWPCLDMYHISSQPIILAQNEWHQPEGPQQALQDLSSCTEG